MSLVSFMSESMSAESLMFNPLANIVRSIIADANGAMFDPSDMTTMYQDAAGTTPVTAVEQPVGLMLDKSQGLVLGPELITNGDFSNGLTGWTVYGADGVTVQDGVVTLDGTSGSASRFGTNISTVAGEFYKVIARIKNGSDYPPNIVARDGTFPNTLGAILNVSVSVSDVVNFVAVTIIFRAISSATTIYLNQSMSNGGLSYMKGPVTVKSIKGNHATQSVTASRPVLSARKNVLLATETLATQYVTSIAAQYTLSFTGTGSVTLSGTATGTLTGTGVNDRVSLTVTPTAGALTLTVSGSVTKAQLELGSSAGPYQRVNTATDYDTDERYFPKYLRFDGVDDYLNLPYMGLYAGGSASVVVATTVKPSTWSTILAEGAAYKYGLYILARYTATNRLGTFIQNDNANLLRNLETPITQGITTVLSVVDSGSAVTHWVSSGLTGSSNYTRSGTLTNAVTLVGTRPNADTLNGNIYSLIITKSALTDAQRIKCERYAASKAGVIL